jgi:erythromycin esterase-like protein
MERITRRFRLVWAMGFLLLSCKATKDDNKVANPAVLDKGVYALQGEPDLDRLIDQIGNSRYVLLGEASHGTSEYYTWRAAISRRLIQEKGFNIIAVEGDWPDAYQLNRYIKGDRTAGNTAAEALRSFQRWPTWMWANTEVAEWAEWLRSHNTGQIANQKVGFYGLDVYSLWESMEAVMAYMDRVDPSTAQAARNAYQCFASFQKDEQAYASATIHNPNLCEQALLQSLAKVRQTLASRLQAGDEEAFSIEQNALVAVNAQNYYRQMVRNNAESWNVRDRHMMETINRLMQRHGPGAKIIVWEHNTHVGDARATDMQQEGMVNVGQLVREQHQPEGVYIVGFGSYRGSVIAAGAWESPMRMMKVPEAQPGSWEAMLHHTAPANKLVMLHELAGDPRLGRPIGHRAIGVVYNPNSERGNYVPSVMPERYDAFLFIDQTQALQPLPNQSGSRTMGIRQLLLPPLANF